MSFLSATRPLTGLFSKSLPFASGPRRLYSTPRPPNNAPNNTRSQFKVLPIVAIVLIGSGSYALLVKSRTGQTRPTN